MQDSSMTRRPHAIRQQDRLRRALLQTLAAAIACSSATALALPQASDASTSALKKLSLDELMNIEVTSVSRRREQLQTAAAAIAVVSSNDIQRSGATSIPEALRLVPGLHIARRNASVWSMGSRGFTSSNSEKLLVLSDTRSLYTPLFAGVFWDSQEYLLEDVERIEVIRGPGAALWGSNAVNGVISITTKNARDTQGGYLQAIAGTEEQVNAAARYGAAINEDIHFRVFAKHAERNSTYQRDAISSDDWQQTLFGFRADWATTAADQVTLQGGAYHGNVGIYSPSIEIIGRAGPTGRLRAQLDGGNVLGRWRHTFSEDSNLQMRFYYDRTERDDPSFLDTLDTYDFDLQHSFRLGSFAGASSHELIWGLNYRYTDNTNEGTGVFRLLPSRTTDSVLSAFLQDQLSLTETLRLTVGSKFEQNDFSGFEVQPSVRASWEATNTIGLWAAVSRAVRVPTRLERDVAIDLSGDPTSNPVPRLAGNENFEAEETTAYELGARWQAATDLFVDVAAFANDYEGLASLELSDPFVDPADGRIVVPVLNLNLTDGESYGIETLVTYVPLPNWQLTASYAYVDVTLEPRGLDLNRGRFLEGATPRHQFALRSSLDLTDALQLDFQFRTLSDVRSTPEIVSGDGVDGYSELDVRLAWQATEALQFSVVGQNLLHDTHVEFGKPAARGEIERGVYGKVAWDF
jgi:iron complex outermembrane recepter protein